MYSARDLGSIRKSLAEIRDIVERGEGRCPHMLLLSLESRLEDCQSLLERLEAGLAILDPDFASIHDTLVLILRLTAAVNTRQEVCCEITQNVHGTNYFSFPHRKFINFKSN